jgi:hypothetical protein
MPDHDPQSSQSFWETFDLISWMCWLTIAAIIIGLLLSCFMPPPAFPQ